MSRRSNTSEAMERKRKVIPPVYFGATIVAMAALHYIAPIARWVDAPYRWLGLVPMLAGISMAIVAERSFRRAGTR